MKKTKKTANDTNRYKQSIKDKLENGLPSEDGYIKERNQSAGQPNKPN